MFKLHRLLSESVSQPKERDTKLLITHRRSKGYHLQLNQIIDWDTAGSAQLLGSHCDYYWVGMTRHTSPLLWKSLVAVQLADPTCIF